MSTANRKQQGSYAKGCNPATFFFASFIAEALRPPSEQVIDVPSSDPKLLSVHTAREGSFLYDSLIGACLLRKAAAKSEVIAASLQARMKYFVF